MSSGELLVFGPLLPRAASLPLIAPALRAANGFLAAREHNKCVLPPEAAACIAVRRLLTPTLVLLEDGQVVSMDGFASWAGEPWVAQAFAQLNALRLPIVDVVVGGRAPVKKEGSSAVPRSGASGPGGHHFLALAASGELFVFGQNDRGQLGLGHTRNVFSPTRVPKFAPPAAENAVPQSNIKLASRAPLPATIVAIAAGRGHSLALTSEGAVYAWGRDMEGQCGLAIAAAAAGGDVRGRTYSTLHPALQVTPRFVHALSAVKVFAIAASNHVSLAVDESGAVWQWGYGLAKEQLNVPQRVLFEDEGEVSQKKQKTPPTISRVALGNSHALLLSTEGEVYSFGLGLTGALGLDFPSGLAHAPRVVRARKVDPFASGEVSEARFVGVFASAFSSALLDSEGRVFVCGSVGDGGDKLGLGADAPAGPGAHVFAPPQLVQSLLGKTVSDIALDAERMVAFVPTKLHAVEPRVVQVQGGTMLSLSGAGFFARPASTTAQGKKEMSQVVVSFSYLGASVVVAAEYDPVSDMILVRSPNLSASQAPESKKGGKYHNAHLENCVVRASLDGGAHYSNALAVHVFSAPDFSVTKGKSGLAAAGAASIQPACGPVQGGSRLALTARFDLLPYQHILVRFRLPSSSAQQDGGNGEGGEIISTVPGEFDPQRSCIWCTTPELAPSLMPPSQPSASWKDAPLSLSRPSRFVRPPVVPPRSTLVSSVVEISLDGQNFFPFAKRFDFYSVAATEVSPATIGVAGADLELRASGVHVSPAAGEQLAVRFSVGGGFSEITVPARFVPLPEHRLRARTERERVARSGRKLAAAAREAARLAAIQKALDEEEARDPKEKERALKEKERAEKEKAKADKAAALQAEKAAAAAAAAAASSSSRPGSSAGLNPDSPSRPRSGSGNNTTTAKRPSSRAGPAAVGAPPTPSSTQKDREASPAQADTSNVEAEASVAPAQEEKDEWSVLEERIASEEAAEDAQLAQLSPADRAAVGYIAVRAPLFTDFGACSPALSVTLNGRDFVPLPQISLRVARPAPTSLSPALGPVSGGTVVEVRGEHFYLTPHIDVQVRPVVAPVAAAAVPAATPATAAPGSSAAGSLAGSALPSTRVSSAGNKPKSASSTSTLKSKSGAAEDPAVVPVASPVAPPRTHTLPAELVVHQAPSPASLRFQSPAWNAAGTATVHVGFDSDSNAYSGGGGSAAASQLSFLFYDAPWVAEAHPSLVSQGGGTEVVLSGRGFVPSDLIRVRLVLQDETEESAGKKAPGAGAARGNAAAAASSDAGSDNNTPGRRKSVTKSSPALSALSSPSAAEISSLGASSAPQRPPAPFLDVPAIRDAHDSPEETEEHAKMLAKKKPKIGGGGGGAMGSKAAAGGAEQLEPEQATIRFTVPSASAFNPLFGENPVSAANRALEVELALNGQQFHPTGIVVRFEKDTKKGAVKPKPAASGSAATPAAGASVAGSGAGAAPIDAKKK